MPGDFLGYSTALSQDGSILAVGCEGSKNVQIYKNQLSSWSPMGTISSSGYIVSLSADGNTIAIGFPTAGLESVSVFVYDGQQWNLSTKITGGINSKFGNSLALSNLGTTLVVGSRSYSGPVNIYKSVNNNWSLVQTIPPEVYGVNFGFSVAISNDGFGNDGYVIAIGASTINANSGSVDVYTYNASLLQWDISETFYGNIADLFGYSIALSQDGSTIAMGAKGANYVKVYKKIYGSWQQYGNTITGPTNSYFGNSDFGISVSLHNDVLAVGANTYDNTGAIFMYEFSNTDWFQTGSTILGTNNSNFGFSTALSADGQTVAVGAYSGGTYPNPGFAQVYHFQIQMPTVNWYWLDISGTFTDAYNSPFNSSPNRVTDLSFSGYFSVDNTNTITALYDTAYTTIPNINVMITNDLVPSMVPGFLTQPDNIYISTWNSFDNSGLYINLNTYSNFLTFLGINNVPDVVDVQTTPGLDMRYFYLAGDTVATNVITTSVLALNGQGSVPNNGITGFLLNYNIRPIVPNQDPSCFIEGTTILCLDANFAEVYVPIKDIRSGMLVKTHLHGFRCVDLIGKRNMVNTHHWNLAVHRLPKSDANGLTEDLYVTGGHSILVDSISDDDLATYKKMVVFETGEPLKIDDKYLLLAGISDQFVKIENEESYVYYHLCLVSDGDDDRRFGIWANGGCLTETVSRNQFLSHNYEIL
jgi:hypothetical protein